jgi:poly(3-hydroxyalkanoate) synthetase
MITHGLIKELLHQIIEKKNIQRKKLKKTQSLMEPNPTTWNKTAYFEEKEASGPR